MPFIVTTKRPVAPDEHGQPFCGACSHYHEGACLCPDCGRPTPCRDHHASASVSTPTTETTSRRAVATLEEAKRAAKTVIFEARATYPKAAWVLGDFARVNFIPESGGSVGPLPDGTVIEMKGTSWAQLAYWAGMRDRVLASTRQLGEPESKVLKPFPPHAEILDAFNEREGER